MAIRKAGIFPIAGIEDFITASDSPDYYDMYLDAGKTQTELGLLALAQEGKMNEAAANALSTVYQGIANSKILEKKAGTTQHPLNAAFDVARVATGFLPSGGGGLGGYDGTEFGTFGKTGTGSITGYTPSFSGSLF